MTRAGMTSFVFGIVALATLPSVAAAETVKAKSDCFDELAAVARRTGPELGRRSGARPIVEDVDEMHLDPLDVADVAQVVRAHLEEIEYCYDRLAARAKAPSGEVSLRLTIEPTGRVTSVSVIAPGVNARSLKTCIATQVKKWRFPAANVETQVDYPLVFDVVTAGR